MQKTHCVLHEGVTQLETLVLSALVLILSLPTAGIQAGSQTAFWEISNLLYGGAGVQQWGKNNISLQNKTWNSLYKNTLMMLNDEVWCF